MELIVTTRQQLSQLIGEAIEIAMANRKEVPQTKVEIIDRDTLCNRLNVTEQTIIRYEKKKVIPRIEIGTSIRYDWNKVITALERKRA